jgi:hypothetical protein
VKVHVNVRVADSENRHQAAGYRLGFSGLGIRYGGKLLISDLGFRI